MKKIELNIVALANSESKPNNFVLILEEQKGFRRLPIIIGAHEAQAIAVFLEKVKTNRPLTHDLYKTTLDAIGATITEVLISDLKEGIFHATMLGKKSDGNLFKIDARSSDAIAMAVRFDCPIYTTPSIMESAGIILDKSKKAFIKKRDKLTDYSLEELEQLLQQVLAKEDYESASKIRDAIKQKKN